MISSFCAIFILSTTILNGQIDQVLNNLDHTVEVQFNRDVYSFDKNEAIDFIEIWMNSLDNPDIFISTSMNMKNKMNSYGLYHIESEQGSFRFFYFSSLYNSTDKISKVKIIKI